MPSRFIFHRNVERFIPRRAAAPFGPPSTQPVSRRTPRMCLPLGVGQRDCRGGRGRGRRGRGLQVADGTEATDSGTG